jgi:hypothetical protein
MNWEHTEPRTVTSQVGEKDSLYDEYPTSYPEDSNDFDYGYWFEARITPAKGYEPNKLSVDITFRDCDPEHAKEFAERLVTLTREFFRDDPRTYDWSKRDVELTLKLSTPLPAQPEREGE